MGKLITIGREFGSGGREFGRRLAEELNIDYYDKEIVTEISKHTSLSEEYVHRVMESQPHQLYPITIGQTISYVDSYPLQQIQSVYQAQTDIIKSLAEKSDCVIVGRCADYILRDYKPFRIFVYADMDSRVQRCFERSPEEEHYTDKQMKKRIHKIDKNRAKYYEFYTGQKWGYRKNYDLCVNTTDVSIKDTVHIFAKLFE
ncbi:MAG: cytidylate kinase-like family protein [Clostridia bacterium]|nr:cytidylate kinase-like family protein [Clostridia bacterium]